MGLFHHNRHPDGATNTDMAQTNAVDQPRYNTQDPSVRTDNAMHPDMMSSNAGMANAANTTTTGNHHDVPGMHRNNGAPNYYDDSYDNVPANAGNMDNTVMCNDASCTSKHHTHSHHGMAGVGLGAAAGGVAGAAVGKHMHNHNHNHNDHGLHHNRSGTIPRGPGVHGDMAGGGMTGDGMDGAGMTGAGVGGMEPTTVIAEENNNFPGTNPHPAHSALSTRGEGHGLAFPGRV